MKIDFNLVKKKTTGRSSIKSYKCRKCGLERKVGTNHWGAIYNSCEYCGLGSILDCQEAVPEGYSIPEEWKMVRLGDIADIVDCQQHKTIKI